MTGPDVELVREGRTRCWYDDRDNLADLYRYLAETEPRTDFEYLIRKPWKWGDVYEQMRREEELERLYEGDACEADVRRRTAL